ncbi:collagen alpha-3(VI) chain-like [Alosa pseudoharengus]|uniref:collagen alpha-3(VI) chain-like n=1 Tax=Alosa pseudoharengus TaxID=34774 RepID=UPI003F891635
MEIEPPTIVGRSIFVLVELDAAQRDIVFLLDGSDDTRDEFPAILQFVENVAEKLSVDQNHDQLSVVQYSRDPVVNFHLNTHESKRDVISAIRNLRHKGGSPQNLGVALEYVKQNIFSPSSGSRRLEGVPQILIVLTGGRSQDDVRRAAIGLKEEKILSFTVGTQNADIIQLQTVAHIPSYTISIHRFGDLQSIQHKLLSFVKHVPRSPRLPSPPVVADMGRSDIAFLIDASDDSESFPLMKDFVLRVVETLEFGPNKCQVALVQYSDQPSAAFLLNTHSTKDDIIDSVKQLKQRGGGPLNTGTALQYVRDEVFAEAFGSRRLQGVPQLLVLLSGGRSRDDIRSPTASLKAMGVIPVSIGTAGADTLELQTISREPNYYFMMNDINDIPTVKDELLSLVKSASPQKTLTSAPASFESTKKDIVFLLDGSEDTRTGFEWIRGFIQKIIENLNIEENGDRVALVQYSREARANFYLNSYSSKNDMLNVIQFLRHKRGRPLNTGAALQFLKDNVFIASSGSRVLEGVPQILYMFSGGRSNDDVRAVSQVLRDSNIRVIAVGTQNADTLELQTVSYTPAHAFSVSDFSNIENVHDKLISSMTYTQEFVEPTSTILDSTTGMKRDVVFLIDGSDDMRNRFSAIRAFVGSMVEKFDVSQNKDQVAVVQFSNTPATEFTLNTHRSTESVLNAVRSLRPKGGRPHYTGKALQFVKDSVFTSNAGSRHLKGVPQILVVLTGGRSRDSPHGPAGALKRMGVLTFAIGSQLTDQVEMQVIASQSEHAFISPGLLDFKNIQQSLMTKFSVIKDGEIIKIDGFGNDVTKRDVIFLVDSSDHTRSGFQAIRNFINDIVSKLDVQSTGDRVSVIQFSNIAVANFYLNSFLKKEDVLNAIKGLTHKGGRPLNVGRALQFVKDNILTTQSGSRYMENVPQILILLVGGKSRDSVEGPALGLKDFGVRTFVIGTGNSDRTDLERIAIGPSHIQLVPDSSGLSNIQQQLLSAITSLQIETTALSPTVNGKDNCIFKNCESNTLMKGKTNCCITD